MKTTDPSLVVSFDIGGVISKYPELCWHLVGALHAYGAEVHIVTDMHDKSEVIRQLMVAGFGSIPPRRVHCADYTMHGEGCKKEILEQIGADIHIDDFLGYSAEGGAEMNLLVMPNARKPYWAPDWDPGEAAPEFGRRVYRKDSDSA